jgi:hypothetical protein
MEYADEFDDDEPDPEPEPEPEPELGSPMPRQELQAVSGATEVGSSVGGARVFVFDGGLPTASPTPTAQRADRARPVLFPERNEMAAALPGTAGGGPGELVALRRQDGEHHHQCAGLRTQGRRAECNLAVLRLVYWLPPPDLRLPPLPLPEGRAGRSAVLQCREIVPSGFTVIASEPTIACHCDVTHLLQASKPSMVWWGTTRGSPSDALTKILTSCRSNAPRLFAESPLRCGIFCGLRNFS